MKNVLVNMGKAALYPRLLAAAALGTSLALMLACGGPAADEGATESGDDIESFVAEEPQVGEVGQALGDGWCTILRPYAWDGPVAHCIEPQNVPSPDYLLPGETRKFFSGNYPGHGHGNVTVRCNPDGTWTAIHRLCRPKQGGGGGSGQEL
jgi:hypothetical protein